MRTRKTKNTALFLFDPAQVGKGATPATVARLIWLFLSLLRLKQVSYPRYRREFSESERTFQRDLRTLRNLGDQFGFTLSNTERGVYRLGAIADLPDDRRTVRAHAADALRAVADALGAVVANDIAAYVDTASAPADPFLRIATPRLMAENDVAHRYRELREAWLKRARVRFRYPTRTGSTSYVLEERVVEPHLTTYYGGRYYLVAYDRRPRTVGWRQFALDRIEGPLRVSGSFTPQSIPLHYRGEDAIGLFKSGPSRHVTIEVSPLIAGAVFARVWQRGQQTARGRDGWSAITFEVHDVGEAVRWAFGFGSEARVVAPDDAVTFARDLALTMVGNYEFGATSARRA
jgi:predicted DNA-binding transcriptional regulator YafY